MFLWDVNCLGRIEGGMRCIILWNLILVGILLIVLCFCLGYFDFCDLVDEIGMVCDLLIILV